MPDSHEMAVTVKKTFFERLQPGVVNNEDYRYFENDSFRTDLFSELGRVNIEENGNMLNNFLDACKRILDTGAAFLRCC